MFLKQKNFPVYICCLLWVLIIPSGRCLQAVARVVQEEWQIQVGDSQTYVIKEYYDFYAKKPYESSSRMMDEDNNSITVVFKKGLIFRYEITFLSSDEARGKITFNKTITSQEQSISSSDFSGFNIVRPSINNKTYWEEYCRHRDSENVTGDLIISETTTKYSKLIYTWNWKTGWFNNFYSKNWNETIVFSVFEISLAPTESFLPLNVLFGGFIFVIIVLILLGIQKFK